LTVGKRAVFFKTNSRHRIKSVFLTASAIFWWVAPTAVFFSKNSVAVLDLSELNIFKSSHAKCRLAIASEHSEHTMSTTELPTLPEHRSKAALAAAERAEREALAAGRREETRRCIELAAVARFYLVQQPGPTLFMLKEDGSETTYKIAIGEQKCSCMRRPALCIHVVGTRRVVLCWL
jgi:hypothetical protein